MLSKNLTHTSSSEEAELNVEPIIRSLKSNWKIILKTGLLFTVAALIYTLLSSPIFIGKGSLLVEDNSQAKKTDLSSLLSNSSSSSLMTQSILIKEDALLVSVIQKLGMNAVLKANGSKLGKKHNLLSWYLGGQNTKNYVNRLYVSESALNESITKPISLSIYFNDASNFTVYDKSKKLGSGYINKLFEAKDLSFQINYVGRKPLRQGFKLSLTIQPASLIVNSFEKSLNVSTEARSSSLDSSDVLKVSFASTSPYFSQRAINVLFNEFLNQHKEWSTEESRAVVDFIDSQLTTMKEDLNSASMKLSQFQKKSGLVSLKPQIEADVKKISEYEIRLRNARLKELELRQLSRSLSLGKPDKFLLSYVDDPLLQKLGGRLSEVTNEIEQLKTQFTEEYPPLKVKREEQRSLIKEMQTALNNYLERARFNLAQLEQTLSEFESEYSDLPEGARALTDYQRSANVFEGLYKFLLQERQKAKISEASTLSSIKITNPALLPLKPDEPSPLKNIFIALILGSFGSALFIVIKTITKRSFSSLDEIKENFPMQPVYSVIPFRGHEYERASSSVIESKLQSPFAESLRLLRTNLFHSMAGKKNQTILVTSTMPGDGKTSVATNLAIMLAKSEKVKKVVLIDADLHKPSVNGVFSLNHSCGLSDFLNGSSAEIIHRIAIDENNHLDVIPSGVVPPSPVELLETNQMASLVQQLSETYDFVIIDSPPYPLVASASILAPMVDRVLSVVRVDHTDKSILIENLGGLAHANKNVGLVVNSSFKADQESSYSSYGTYGYSSGYYGQIEDKPKRVSVKLQKLLPSKVLKIEPPKLHSIADLLNSMNSKFTSLFDSESDNFEKPVKSSFEDRLSFMKKEKEKHLV